MKQDGFNPHPGQRMCFSALDQSALPLRVAAKTKLSVPVRFATGPPIPSLLHHGKFPLKVFTVNSLERDCAFRNLTVRRIVAGPVGTISTAALQSAASTTNSGASAGPVAHLPANQRASCSVAFGMFAIAGNGERPPIPKTIDKRTMFGRACLICLQIYCIEETSSC